MVRRIFDRGRHRGAVALGALVTGAALVLSACTSQPTVVVTVTTTSGAGPVTVPTLSSSGAPQSTSSQPQPTTGTAKSTGQPTSTTGAAAATMRVSANPAFGTKKMAPNDPITVTVFNAELQKVTLLGDDGSAISGKITNDKHTWIKSERLKYGTTYTLTGTAKATDGSTKTIDGTFTTVKPTKTMPAYVNIPDGETVGIAAPIIITFAGAVKDRAAAEKMLKVTVNGKTIVGSWGWMQDEDIQGKGVKQSRVHFRPKDYWPANASVKLTANLYGVNYGGTWGREDLVRNFKIGPKLIIKTDVPDHRLLVIKNDEVFKNYPVSYGVPKTDDPNLTTVSGVHVVMEKKPGAFTMCNPKYDYCGVTEYWGVRINNNGEFIHANTKVEKEGLLGKANVSHGCINMSMADAKELFNMVYYGVPVDVEGTGVKMSYSDYIWDWGVDYATWKTFSAL